MTSKSWIFVTSLPISALVSKQKPLRSVATCSHKFFWNLFLSDCCKLGQLWPLCAGLFRLSDIDELHWQVREARDKWLFDCKAGTWHLPHWGRTNGIKEEQPSTLCRPSSTHVFGLLCYQEVGSNSRWFMNDLCALRALSCYEYSWSLWREILKFCIELSC